MAVVVISSAGEGDRAGGSLDVKAPGGREIPGQIRPGVRATWQAAAMVNLEAPKYVPRVKQIAGGSGVPSRSDLGEGPCPNRSTGHSRFVNSPGSVRAACREGSGSESPEPLGGRLGAPAQRRQRV